MNDDTDQPRNVRTVTQRQLEAVDRLAKDEDDRIRDLARTARQNIEEGRDNGTIEVVDGDE